MKIFSLKIFYFFFLTLLAIPSPSQVKVNTSKDIIDAVKSLEGPGVKISNIYVYAPPFSPSPPIAYFEDQSNYTGIDKGLLLTSGGARLAEGPNDKESEGQDNNSTLQDPYLQSLTSGTLHDFCFVEFDILTSSPQLSFQYVFGSEEYEEYTGYGDVFALTISGPGITGKKNLALVPGTNTPVSVSNINQFTNQTYYRKNTYWNPNLQYDGLTVVLTASTTVTPCETYRIRLAIADAIDGIYDSGVFIKQGSFKSEDPPIISISYEHPEFDYAIENCNKGFVNFQRPSNVNINTTLTYNLTIGGTAVNGTDYSSISQTVTIPSGQSSTTFTINPILDNVKEGTETIRITIQGSCPQFPELYSFEIPLADAFPYSIPTESACYQETIQLNPNPQPGTSIVWENNPNLSCQNCLSPIVTSEETEYYTFTITHNSTGCAVFDSVLVNEVKIIPDFEYYSDTCYTSLDITFKNTSTTATRFYWDFGDGHSSDERSPVHTYNPPPFEGSITYTVHMVARTTSPAACSEEIIKIITISEPIFIPNLITAGKDDKNDNFKISGIGGECWTLYLFNRWGALIYKKENYIDELEAEKFDSGNYFYLIENENKDRTFRGWLHIVSK
jgi:hypothetical protein